MPYFMQPRNALPKMPPRRSKAGKPPIAPASMTFCAKKASPAELYLCAFVLGFCLLKESFMPIEAVIFDMDGVIVDSEEYWWQSRVEFDQKRGLIWSFEDQKGAM